MKFIGLRVSALIEIFLFLAIFSLWDLFLGSGNHFLDAQMHPFWIIVVLVSVQYGTAEGLVAVLCSIAVLYSGGIPLQRADETLFGYQERLGFLPSLWFVTAFVLGELRMRMSRENAELKAQFLHAKVEAEAIAAEYTTLKELSENLEIRLATQDKTTANALEVFRALEALEPSYVVFGLGEQIKASLSPEKFSVYAKGPSGFEAVISSGWTPEDHFKRRITPDHPLYHAIAEERKLLSVVNKEDRRILGDEGILAAPLADPDTGELFGVVKIEKMDFRSLNLTQIETFRTVCSLTGQAYANARRYHALKSERLYAIAPWLLSHNTYQWVKRSLFQVSAFFKEPPFWVELSRRGGGKIEPYFLEKIVPGLPVGTMLFEGSRVGQIYMLLWKKTGDEWASVCQLIEAKEPGRFVLTPLQEIP